MLDVHPPHHRLESLRDFLVHLLTITVGLLIAVGIEGCVEWRHHVHLVEEARTTLRAEIAANLQQLKKAKPVLEDDRRVVDEDLATLRRIQEAQPNSDKDVSLTVNLQSADLNDTAWRAAQSTGALGYMPYDEARRYSGVYQMQARFEDSQHVVLEDDARFFGQVYQFDLARPGPISAEHATAMAEEFGSLKFHLSIVHLMLEEASRYDEALLQNKPEPGGLHEDLK